jgi:hypothetical protein
MFLSFGEICLGSKCLPLPSMGVNNTYLDGFDVYLEGCVVLVGPVGNVLFNVIGTFDNY